MTKATNKRILGILSLSILICFYFEQFRTSPGLELGIMLSAAVILVGLCAFVANPSTHTKLLYTASGLFLMVGSYWTYWFISDGTFIGFDRILAIMLAISPISMAIILAYIAKKL